MRVQEISDAPTKSHVKNYFENDVQNNFENDMRKSTRRRKKTYFGNDFNAYVVNNDLLNFLEAISLFYLIFWKEGN